MPALLLRSVRLVPVAATWSQASPDRVVDVRLEGDRVREVAPALHAERGDVVLAGEGRWLAPGLWDAHVHATMWALARRRIDLAGAGGPEETLSRVRQALSGPAAPKDPAAVVIGYGFRSGTWPRLGTVAELDAVAGDRPVALASGDGHNGWVSSAALRLLGRGGPDAPTGPLTEDEWYAAYAQLSALATRSEDPEAAVRDAVAAAAARGVVGIVDFEFYGAWRSWRQRYADGLRSLRVRAATYEADLTEVATAGLRTGDPLVPGQDLVTMGPLKVISDGSLNTLTAWCAQPYAGGESLEFPRGRANTDIEVLAPLLSRAAGQGLRAAVHAIGDEAVANALDAFEVTGQRGSIEHAQLVALGDLPRMARLGLTASVQPPHLLDDRDVTQRWWPDRTERTFAFAAMSAAGVRLALGSDAPVSPLDPWSAMAAAVHRTADERPPWHPEQSLTPAQALAASVDGAGTVAPGSRADLVLLDADPYAAGSEPASAAAHLRGMSVHATVVGGAVTYQTG